MIKYTAVKPFQLNAPIDAEEVGAELKKIASITPTTIVKLAKDKSSPLHKYFEWDDTEAAKKYRLTQARNLILAIGFESENGFTRAFESVVINNNRVYIPIDKIANSPDLIDQVMKAALGELVFWKAKHQKYKTFFGGVFDEIDKSEEAYRSKYEEKANKGGGAARVKADHSANKKAGRKRDNSRRQSTAS